MKSNLLVKFIIFLSLTFVGLLLISYVAGFRYFTVVSPSMGETAPVGTFVVTYPQDKYIIDDIVSFYRGDRVYTHRIISINSDGEYITKGDLNSVNDSIPLSGKNIIGKAVAIYKYFGWLWRAFPVIAIGVLISYIISKWKKVRVDYKWPVRIIGYCISVMIATFIFNPWARVDLLGYDDIKAGGIQMSVVNTGILPLKDDSGDRFYPGQVRSVRTENVDEKGRFYYVPRISLGFWGTIFVLIWCLIPMIVAMIVKIPLPEEYLKMKAVNFEKEKRWSGIVFCVIVVSIAIILVIHLSAHAAFVAQVGNSHNSTRANPYFTCDEAQSSKSSPRPIFSYSMSSPHNSGVLPDISGNSNNGVISGSSSLMNTGKFCVRVNDPDSFMTYFNGSSTCAYNETRFSNPTDFTIEAWFSTTKTGDNGKIIGFSSHKGIGRGRHNADRMIYLDNRGRLIFGMYPNRLVVLSTPAGKSYADGEYHHVIATVSSTEGANFYVDGVRIASDPSAITGENYSGYWNFGCGVMTSWRNGDGGRYNGSPYFTGMIRNVAVYDSVMSENEVIEHYVAGK